MNFHCCICLMSAKSHLTGFILERTGGILSTTENREMILQLQNEYISICFQEEFLWFLKISANEYFHSFINSWIISRHCLNIFYRLLHFILRSMENKLKINIFIFIFFFIDRYYFYLFFRSWKFFFILYWPKTQSVVENLIYLELKSQNV